MHFTIFVTYFVLASGSILWSQINSWTLPPQCDPEVLDDAPFQLRKVCAALSTLYRLSGTVVSYPDDSSARQLHYLKSDLQEKFGIGNNVKRQDLDHVFLRFGKRR